MLPRLTKLQRNMLVIIIVGLVCRYVFGVLLTYPRDIASWVVNSENFFMDEGLYGLPGHYYTPVWGYIMAILTAIAGFAGIPVSQYVDEFTGVGAALPWYTTLPTMEYALLVKTFLFIVDLLVMYVVFRIGQHVTGSDRVATILAAVWFLCPLTIVISSIRVMFENVEILFMLASLLMALRGRPAEAGALMAISLLTKPYGMFLGIMLIGYLYARSGNLRNPLVYILSTAVTVGVLLLPVVATGGLEAAFSWLTIRAGNVSSGYNSTLYLIPVLVCLSAVSAFILAYLRNTDFRTLMCLVLLFTGVMMVSPGNIQYYLVLLPMAILTLSRWSAVLVAIVCLLSVFAGVSFTIWSAQLYAAEGLWGYGALIGFGQWVYPFESTLDYNLLKTICGYAAVLIPVAIYIYPRIERRFLTHDAAR